MLDIGSILYSAHSELTDTNATVPSWRAESKPAFSMALIAFSLIGVLIYLLSRDVRSRKWPTRTHHSGQ